MKRIFVGADGSGVAAGALVCATRLAGPCGAEVVVASAFFPNESELRPDRYDDLQAPATRSLETEWSAPAREAGIEYRTLLCQGEPGVLLEAAEAEDADLLVVGTRDRGGFAGLHVGSVAHHLAHHTTRPLAIVPAAATNPQSIGS